MAYRITELWAWVASSSTGDECVVSSQIPGLGTVPLIGCDEARANALRPFAARASKVYGQPVRLVRFTTRTEMGLPLGAH